MTDIGTKGLMGIVAAGMLANNVQGAEAKDLPKYEKEKTSKSEYLMATLAPKYNDRVKVLQNFPAVLQDTLKGKKLSEAERVVVLDMFKKALQVNDTAISVQDLRLQNPKARDITKKGRKKAIQPSKLSTAKIYQITQDFPVRFNTNISENEKHADKVNDLKFEGILTKVMQDNRHMVSLSDLKAKGDKYIASINAAGTDLVLNGLMVFDMRGNNMVNSKIKSLEVNYDKKATKEKIADHIQNIPFAISLDDSVLDALPNYMKHIPLKGIMLNAIKWNNEAKHVGGDGNNELAKWERMLSINGEVTKELVAIPLNYDDENISVEIKAPKNVTKNILGFDLDIEFSVVNGGLEINIPKEGDHGLQKFVDHIEKSFRMIWNKLNKTHLGDPKTFVNLKKVPYMMGSLATTKTSPKNTTIDLSTGFKTNITTKDNPFYLRVLLENKIAKKTKNNKNTKDTKNDQQLKFVDMHGRTLGGRYIKYGEFSGITMGEKEEGFKIKEFKGDEQNYSSLDIKGPAAPALEKSRVSHNTNTNELVYRDRENHEIVRIPTTAEEYGTTKTKKSSILKENVGYFYDKEKGDVEISSDNFSYLLQQAPQYEYSIIDTAVKLGISETKVYEKFKELFDKKFDGKKKDNKLKGLIVNNRYVSVKSDKENKTLEISYEIPDEVKEILDELKLFVHMLYRLDNVSIIVSPDGNLKSGKHNRKLNQSIGGETGIGRTRIKGLSDFVLESDDGNTATYTIIDGNNNQVPIKFTVEGDDIEIADDKEEISIDGVPYELKYKDKTATLYLIPQKEQIKAGE